MKKVVFSLLMTMIVVAVNAQPNHSKRRESSTKVVSELVSGLTSLQKQQIETIRQESSAKVSQFRKQQKMVKDSIKLFMDKDGDQSAMLFPLFDREAFLQVQINREMYNGKVKIDAILTEKQRAELHQTTMSQQPHKKHK